MRPKFLKSLPSAKSSLAAMPQRRAGRDSSPVQTVAYRQLGWQQSRNEQHCAQFEACSSALSPDGCIVATCHGDRTVKLWDAKTGQRIQTLLHQQPIWKCSFAPSGWGIVTAGVGGKIWLWDLETSRCFGKLQGHTGWIYDLDFSPVDDVVASGSTDTTVRLWNIATGKCIAIFEGHDRPVQTVKFDSTGQWLTSYDDQVMKIWDIQTGACVKEANLLQ